MKIHFIAAGRTKENWSETLDLTTAVPASDLLAVILSRAMIRVGNVGDETTGAEFDSLHVGSAQPWYNGQRLTYGTLFKPGAGRYGRFIVEVTP